MTEVVRSPQSWLKFIGSVLVVAVLYGAQAVIVPVSVAVLMTFLLTPIVSSLQRHVGRIPAVLAVVILAFTALAAAGWALTQQLTSLVQQLPAYEHNIRQKIHDVQGAGKNGSVERLQKTAEHIQAALDEQPEAGTTPRPIVVRPEQVGTLWSLPSAIAPLLAPLATGGLIVALVSFMLLEREALRNRLIRLFGYGRLVATTKAFDEAGRRVSQYLFAQSLVNLTFGTCVGAGLLLIGVPYPFFWAALAAALRFVPYLGVVIAAGAPFLVALAAFEGWTRPALVLVLFVGLELLANLVVETILYSGAVGISQVALLVAVAFWSWLWGPLGLLLATPLTVCLVVMGKYVPGWEFVSTLMSDEPVLAPDVSYYQRLIAGDQAEAVELLERHVQTQPESNVYDAIMLPALNYAERDRIQGRLTAEDESAVVEATRELLVELQRNPARQENRRPVDGTIAILGVAAQQELGTLALRMLEHLSRGTGVALEIQPTAVLLSEVLEEMERGRYRAVCIADLPPSMPLKSRYLVKRLRARLPNLPILVGRWAPSELADDTPDALLAAGASHVATSLAESRDFLEGLVPQLSCERSIGA